VNIVTSYPLVMISHTLVGRNT